MTKIVGAGNGALHQRRQQGDPASGPRRARLRRVARRRPRERVGGPRIDGSPNRRPSRIVGGGARARARKRYRWLGRRVPRRLQEAAAVTAGRALRQPPSPTCPGWRSPDPKPPTRSGSASTSSSSSPSPASPAQVQQRPSLAPPRASGLDRPLISNCAAARFGWRDPSVADATSLAGCCFGIRAGWSGSRGCAQRRGRRGWSFVEAALCA
jgi:hypothetical protein